MNEEWPWPAALDAVIAAPEFHTVLYEDERVRVLEGLVPQGVTVPLHTHRFGGVLYLSARVISSGGARTARSSSTPRRAADLRRRAPRVLGRPVDAAHLRERGRLRLPHVDGGDEGHLRARANRR